MATINGRSYSTPRNLNLKGQGVGRGGILLFEGTNSTTPISSTDNGLYVNASDQLIYYAQGVSTIIGAAGSGGTPTWDTIYAGDQKLIVSSTTFTIDGTHASNDVLTLTSTGAGTGDLLQITNVGTGKDINGTSGTWSFSKTGQGVMKDNTIAGTAGSTSWTLTAGDMVVSDGSLAITDADNAATFSVTNDTATTASVFVLAGSGAFTGSTTTSFLTLTPSGLTTGTAVYLPLAALTTGKGIHVVANAVTDGLILNITSSSTVHTATGRLLNVASTAATNTSAVLNEFATAANDETVLLRLTASDLLAAGKILHFSASSMTTGTAIDAAALDALTTGIGIAVASTSTTLTTGSLARFTTATTGAVATNGIVSIRGTGAHTSTSNVGLLDVQSSGMVGTAANSTLVNFKATGAAQVDTTLLNVEASGFTTGFTGTMVRIKSVTTTGSGTVVGVIADGITSGGTAMDISVDALTTGKGLNIDNTGGAMTTGSLLAVTAQGTGAIATNGIISFTHTGAFTSTSAVNGGFVEIKANDTTAGTVLNLVADALTTGIGVQLSNATSAITSGSLLRVTGSGVGTLATNGLVSITHGGIFVSTANAGVLDVQASALVGAGTVANFKSTAASQTAANIVNIEQSGATLTAYTGTIARLVGGFSGSSSTGTIIGVTAVNDTAGDALKITNNALTLGAATMINLSHATSVLGAGTSMLRITSTGVDTGTTTGTLLDLSSAATTGHIMLITATAASTGGALVINTSGASQTSASAIRVTQSGTTTGFTGSLVSITGSSTTGAGNALGITGVNTTTGDTVKITNDALVAGTSTALLISHATSVLGAGNSLLRLSSTSVDTGTTTGTLLDLASAATTGIVQMITANSLTSGTALLVTSSGTVASSGQGVVNIVATGLTTGTALKIDLTEGTLTTGKYIDCFDDTSGASVFSVAENGAILYSDTTEVVTATNVITAAESGSVFFLNSATEFVSTLPAPQAGLNYTFVITAAPSGANYTVVTTSADNVIYGSAEVNGASVPAVAEDSINFVSAAAAIGDWVSVYCDGTNWYVRGLGVAAGAITFTAV